MDEIPSAITAEIRPELNAQLEELASLSQVPKSTLIEEALENYVALQAAHRRHIEEGLADLRAGRYVTQEAMEAWVASWDTEHELPPPE